MELKKYKLADIGKVITGKTPSTSIAENYAWGTIPFYTPEDVAKGLGMMGRNSRFISETGFEEIASNTISGESVLVGCIGSDLGNVAYSNITCATNQQINAITQFKNGIEPLYVYYLLSTMKSYFQKIAGSTTTPILPKSVFEEIEIHLPGMKKQKDVVSILYALDRKIELNKQINDNLEEMAKQLYDYWFVQFDFPNEEGMPYKSSGGEMVWNEKLKREIPKGWEVKHLGDIIETNRGISYNTSSISGGGVPMINLASFNVNGTYKDAGIKTYNGSYTKEKVLKPFDLVLCNTQQTAIDFSKDIIGKAFLVPDVFEGDIVSSHHINTIKTEDYYKAYIAYLSNTSHFHKYAAGCCSGTNILGLDFNSFSQYKMEIPPVYLLEEFQKIIIDIVKRESVIIKENKTLTKLRDELLPLLMNGQATVNYHLSASTSISFDISVLFLNFTNGNSLYETISLDYQCFALPLHSK